MNDKPPMQGPVALHEFRCDECMQIYDKGWPDEVARLEAITLHGMDPADREMALICDDCFNEIMPEDIVDEKNDFIITLKLPVGPPTIMQ